MQINNISFKSFKMDKNSIPKKQVTTENLDEIKNVFEQEHRAITHQLDSEGYDIFVHGKIKSTTMENGLRVELQDKKTGKEKVGMDINTEMVSGEGVMIYFLDMLRRHKI